MTYADVAIRIREEITKEVEGQHISCYLVELTVDGERESSLGYLDATTRPPNPTDPHYADAEFGQELFAWLFTAREFARLFCGWPLDHGQVDLAANEARQIDVDQCFSDSADQGGYHV
jgi:hypothetical protein